MSSCPGNPTQNNQIQDALASAHGSVVTILQRLGAGDEAEAIYARMAETICADPSKHLGKTRPDQWRGHFVKTACRFLQQRTASSTNEVEQIKQGLVEARQTILNILLRMGAGGEAEDIYHGVVERIMGNPRKYMGRIAPAKWTGYLVNAARNRFLDFKRSRRKLVSGDSGPGQGLFDTLPASESRPADEDAEEIDREALRCYEDVRSGPGGALAEAIWELAPHYDYVTAVDCLRFLTAFVDLKMGLAFGCKRKEVAQTVPYNLRRQNGQLKEALNEARLRWIRRRRR